MNTINDFKSVETGTIPAYEIVYQQALLNDEKFHVLRDIREAINKLKLSVENKALLKVDHVIIAKNPDL